jgi:Cytochrome P460
MKPLDGLNRRRLTKRVIPLIAVIVSLPALLAATFSSSPSAGDGAGVAVAEGKLPPGYRDWRLISVAREEGDLDDIRAVLGNDAAIDAYRGGTRSFPDGTVIARLAWSYESSAENDKSFGRKQSFVAGHPKNGVQFMVKDATRYASTGGWLYAQFDDGKPLRDAAQLQSCFQCHQAVNDRDYVFTRYAP